MGRIKGRFCVFRCSFEKWEDYEMVAVADGTEECVRQAGQRGVNFPDVVQRRDYNLMKVPECSLRCLCAT